MILTDLGRFPEAAEALRGAYVRALHFGENEMASWIDFWRTLMLTRSGDATGALSMGRRAIESAERIGSVVGRVGAHGCFGAACVLAGEWQDARESLEVALALGRTRQAARFLDAYYLAAFAEAHLGLRDVQGAREFAEQAIATASRMQMPVAEVQAQIARARVELTQNGADARSEIEATLDRAQALVRSTSARSYEPQIHVERARLAGLRSDAPGREQWLREAHRLFTEMGATGHAERVGLLLAAPG